MLALLLVVCQVWLGGADQSAAGLSKAQLNEIKAQFVAANREETGVPALLAGKIQAKNKEGEPAMQPQVLYNTCITLVPGELLYRCMTVAHPT